MLAAGALLWAGVAPEAWGVQRNATLVFALVCLELGLGALVPVKAGAGRDVLAVNAASTLACWAGCSACVLLFSFVTPLPIGLETRVLSLCAWLCAGGVLAGAAALSSQGAGRARPLLLAVLGLPALLHYIGLEYAGSSQAGLAALSPHWLLARGEIGPAWWLAGIGTAGWCVAIVQGLRPRRAA